MKKIINDYVTDYSECASYDSFESQSDPTEGEDDDNLPLEIEDDESGDSDFIFDSSFSETDEDDIEKQVEEEIVEEREQTKKTIIQHDQK